MPYKLRLIQTYQPNAQVEFHRLERQFVELEQTIPEFPKGRRYVPQSGSDPINTLVWECEFPTLTDVETTLSFLEKDPRHDALFRQQVVYLVETRVEILKTLEL